MEQQKEKLREVVFPEPQVAPVILPEWLDPNRQPVPVRRKKDATSAGFEDAVRALRLARGCR